MPCSDGVKVIWEVVDNHLVEESNDNGDIELLGLYFFDENTSRGREQHYRITAHPRDLFPPRNADRPTNNTQGDCDTSQGTKITVGLSQTCNVHVLPSTRRSTGIIF